nr:alpha/beta hydrolase [Evansella caseinilytica]
MEKEKNYLLSTYAGKTQVSIYWPKHFSTDDQLPVYINLHGGGFVLGFPEQDEFICKTIANNAECVVVNVDYALAPENKFPTAVYECYDVAKWIYHHATGLGIDQQRIAIGGHSAGGNLAIGVCMIAKDRKEFPICCQIVDYAPLDLMTDVKEKTTAKVSESVKEYNAWYFTDKEQESRDKLASPVLADDLSNLPPALVITAELDILRKEGEIFANRLIRSGVQTTYKMFAGCDHGFTHFGLKEDADKAIHLMSRFLKENFQRNA